MSPAVHGGPEDGPVARGTSGGEGSKKWKNGGAGSDGSEPEGEQPHWRSQSGPGPPIDPPPLYPVLRERRRVRLDPRNGNVMMGTDLLKKTTDVLNENLVAARLDGDVPDEAHAILTVSDQVEAAANRLGRDPVRDTNPLEDMIKNV